MKLMEFKQKKNNVASKIEDNIGLIVLCYPNSAHHTKFG